MKRKIFYKHWVFLVAACSAGANLFNNPPVEDFVKSVILLIIMLVGLGLFAYLFVQDIHRDYLYEKYNKYLKKEGLGLSFFFVLDGKELLLFFSGLYLPELKDLKASLEQYLESEEEKIDEREARRVHNILSAYLKDNYNQ